MSNIMNAFLYFFPSVKNMKLTNETLQMRHLFELELIEALYLELSKLSPGDIFIDVGACVGTSSLLIREGLCFAFEMDSDALVELRRNVSLNEDKNIIIMDVPLSNEEIGYEIVKAGRLGDTKIKKNVEISYPKTKTLDTVFSNTKNIRVIKIDAEEEDYNVLLGGKKTIEKNRPVIFVEVKTPILEQQITDFLKSLNYTLERVGINLMGKPGI